MTTFYVQRLFRGFRSTYCPLDNRIINLEAGASVAGAAASEDVKGHSWFIGVDWEALVRKQIQAPFVPPVRHAGDTSNFEEYPEEDFDSVNDHSNVLNDLSFERQDINQIFIDF